MYIMSVENCRNIDKRAIENIGIPSIILMENAASEVVSKVKDFGESFLVICGKGNNGGDGLAIARKLFYIGKRVKIVVLAENEKYSKDFMTNFTIINNMGIDVIKVKTVKEIKKLEKIVRDFSIIIDCIFGVGLNKVVRELYYEGIKTINDAGKRVVSIDVPSGMDADTGLEMGICIRADYTITFEVIKKGFIKSRSVKYLGKLEVVSIGIPKEIKEGANEGIYMLDEDYYKKIVPVREMYGHKGDYGKVVIVAGSKGMVGAAFIATESCLKTGAGLVTLATSKYVQESLSSKLVEAMIIDCSEREALVQKLERVNVVALGPGMVENDESKEIIEFVINNTNCPVVLDAGALNIISNNKFILDQIRGRAVITPHPGEMARLVNESIEYVENNRISVARDFAKKYNIIVLLKGYNTVISNENRVYVNPTGNSKMASGGMGDSLTGIITGYIAQGMDILKAAKLGAFIHGYVGDKVGKKKYNVIARDIIENIQEQVNKFIEE